MTLENVTKKEIISKIADKIGMIQSDVDMVLHEALTLMQDAMVQGRTIEFRGFGVFVVKKTPARIGRNPRKPTVRVQIPERNVVRFRPGKDLKARLSRTPVAQESGSS